MISHLHGDHIYGLPGLLSTMYLNRRDFPITIYGPKGTAKFINYTQPPDSKANRSLNIIEFNGPVYKGIIKSVNLKIYPLDHSISTFGLRLEEEERPGVFYPEKARSLMVPEGPLFGKLQKGHNVNINGKVITPSMVMGEKRRGINIAYIADTVPCENSLLISKNADILIHEGTYLEEDRKKAAEYKHSTFNDAAITAQEANSQKLYITHIGTKYTKDELKEGLRSAKKIFKNTSLAKDLLSINVNYDD